MINYNRRLKRRKRVTYAIGARCRDGIALVADRRIFDGTQFKEGNKIFSCKGILVASSGYNAIIEKLHEKIDQFIEEEMDYREKIETIENIIKELNKNYSPRILLQEIPLLAQKYTEKELEDKIEIIDALVALKDNENQIRLYHIHPFGIAQFVKEGDYCAIGSGEPYGAVFLKKHWEYIKHELRGIFTMSKEEPHEEEYYAFLSFDALNSISLLVFSVLMVEELEVDQNVGEGFDIWIFKDNNEPFQIKEENEDYDEIIMDASFFMDSVDLGQNKEEFERLMEHRKRWDEKKRQRDKNINPS